ncbi:MAG: hypothetical protein JWO71_2740 [Candidatus Acidoferrum typicum]|nr:hypothetical protein [Candidatus Acidoferrum typicum]
MKKFIQARWQIFSQTPFGCLLRLFIARMFHGGGEPGAEELDLGIGVIVIMLAMPGILVSLLMFEKYGSLIRFLRGNPIFDPYTATMPDEYFFLVLSLVVTGAAALWRWDALFLDRRDYTNLVPLPLSLRAIFFANLAAILALAALFTIVVNAASLLFFPMAVVGSQNSFAVWIRFTLGHAVAVFTASAFSFFAVFALAGLLMAVLPAALFRRVSHAARFIVAIGLLALLASSFTVPYPLTQLSVPLAHKIAALPPVSFLGLARTIWLKGADPFAATMSRAAISAVALAILIALVAYALSFRRSFIRIPEMADAGPLPRFRHSVSPLAPLHKAIFRAAPQRACYHFVARTLLRSDGHLQILLGFAALGLVLSAEALSSAPNPRSLVTTQTPSAEFLSIPFTLAYCVILGIRFAFGMPVDLRANWIFRYWLDPNQQDARAIARRVLLLFSLPWLAPAAFFSILFFWGWTAALLHTAILIACTVVLIELLLIRFRKIPFTCSYPSFQSHSALIFAAYLFGFLFFTDYLPQMEHWSMLNPWQTIVFAPLLALTLLAVRQYRKQMLDMDKQLIFEEPRASTF